MQNNDKFSTHYFSRYSAHPAFFEEEPPGDEVGMVVVIPCYDDAMVFDTLRSLETTKPPTSSVEVVVVVNSGETTPDEVVQENRRIFAELQNRSQSGYYLRFKLLPIIIENIPKKRAGVGYARKTGMDEAVRRLAGINNPDGIIISLDADTLVDEAYFACIENAFRTGVGKEAFTLQFEHDFNPDRYSKEEIEACRLYEAYLRYFKWALGITGFPYCFHTLGSCFAVTARAYVKVGGMPFRQGGEDFYFLHKLAPMTSVGEITETLVYHSPRISNRVPFGTGPSVKNIIENKKFHVYHFDLFLILKRFFDCFNGFSNSDNLDNVPVEIIDFIGEKKLLAIINECRLNAKGEEKLTKRLFSKFDAFFIVKFLHSFGEDTSKNQIVKKKG